MLKKEPSLEAKYVTKDGRPARIICVDRAGHPMYPLIALIKDPTGRERIRRYTVKGVTNYDQDSELFEEGPYSDFEIGEPVMVSADGSKEFRRYFAGVAPSGNPTAFNNGATPWSIDDSTPASSWKNCRKLTAAEREVYYSVGSRRIW